MPFMHQNQQALQLSIASAGCRARNAMDDPLILLLHSILIVLSKRISLQTILRTVQFFQKRSNTGQMNYQFIMCMVICLEQDEFPKTWNLFSAKMRTTASLLTHLVGPI